MVSVCLVNKYGDIVVELVDDYGYYKLPDGFVFDNLAVGDEYYVKAYDEDGNEVDM